jgi:hypothetical protein
VIRRVRDWVGGLENLSLRLLGSFRLPLASHSGFAGGFIGPFIDFLPPSSFLLLALIPRASIRCAALGLSVCFGVFVGFR